EQGVDRLFRGAPAAILVGVSTGAGCQQEDCLRATQNMILGAHALGLGTCLIGYAVAAMKEAPGIARDRVLRNGRGRGLCGGCVPSGRTVPHRIRPAHAAGEDGGVAMRGARLLICVGFAAAAVLLAVAPVYAASLDPCPQSPHCVSRVEPPDL
ncbi:nitroreductase family protein, partial [Oceanidesulfovibrio marinus]